MTPMDDALADIAKPGWIPLVIVLVMFVAVYFLWRSMRKMLRTIEPGLPHEDDLRTDDPDAAGGNGGAAPSEVELARQGKGPHGRPDDLLHRSGS